MGKAPNVKCPEGTRIIAPVSKNPKLSGFWLSGTVGVMPKMQNTHQYLVFFVFYFYEKL